MLTFSVIRKSAHKPLPAGDLIAEDRGCWSLKLLGKSVQKSASKSGITAHDDADSETRLELHCRPGCRGAFYSAKLGGQEQYLFPYRGREHVLLVLAGEIRIQERNLSQQANLLVHDGCRISLTGKNTYLDARATGVAEESRLVWIVIHVDPAPKAEAGTGKN